MSVVLAVLFLLSGAAGLFYEAVWSRYLSLFVGHSAYAQVLTLVIFLGGMGIGAWVVSRRSARIRDPLFAYAVVEAVIGLIGLAFHDVLYLPVTGWAYDALFPALAGGALSQVGKWLLAALLILPQSILLGATFPLMTAGVLRRLPGQPGRTLSVMYFSNSFGAALGVLFAGFVLYRMAGLPGTLAAAAMLNLVVALGAIVVTKYRPVVREAGSGKRESGDGEPTPDSRLPIPDKTLTVLLLTLAFGTAVASFIYEIGWIRMLSLVLGSSTHAFELMLSAFILGLALGSWWMRRRADRLADPLRTLARIQLLMGALALLSLPLYLQSFQWTAALLGAVARTEPGYLLFNLARYLICLAIMLPATFCAGMTLPLMTRMLLTGGQGERAIGSVYAANTLGSIVGAAATGLLLLPALGLRGVLVFGGALDMLLGLLALRALARAGQPVLRLALAGGGTLALLSGFVLLALPWSQGLLSSGVFRIGRVWDDAQREILYHADGRTATVHATRVKASGIRILATNGKPDGSLTPTWFERCDTTAPRLPFSSDDGTQAMVALLLLAHAPEARRGAVIGHGTGMSSHFLLASPKLTRLSTIEIEPAMVAGARAFYPANRRVFEDPRSEVVIDDAKSFFAATTAPFDVVLSEPSNPWVSGVSGLFTTEFYGRIGRYLAPGAVFGQWVQTYELTDGLVLSVLAALHENFQDYRVFLINGGDVLVVASRDRPLPPPDWSVARLPAVQADLCRFQPMSEAALERILIVDRAGLTPLLARGVQPNSDFYPVLDLGAEASRFMQQSAAGVANLGSGIADYISDPALAARRFDTATTSVLLPAPRVKAMLLAAQLRQPAPDSGWADAPGASERHLQRVWWRQSSSDGAGPVNWRGWSADFWAVRRSLHGGGAPVDTAFFGRARSFAARAGAPVPVRAAIALGEALARRELAAGAAPADELLREARAGRFWIPPDDLLDGAVRSLLAAGRVEQARTAYDLVVRYSTRPPGDLRLALLNSYIEGAKESGH